MCVCVCVCRGGGGGGGGRGVGWDTRSVCERYGNLCYDAYKSVSMLGLDRLC